MSILKLRSGNNALGMLRYCYEDKKEQSADTQRCTDFINSYSFDNIEDVSLAWRMERQGCGKENGRQYYHATLSVNPDDPRASTIRNRELRDMGERFVKEFAPGHSYAVFVHRDEKHPHVHILWNSVNPESGKKFHLDNADLGRSQEIKNRIDVDFGIKKTELKKPEVQKDRIPDEVKRIIERTETAYIWTEDLKQRIDITKKKSMDMQDFKDRLKETGIDAQERGKEGKITYSFEDEHGKQRKVRQDKLGENYGRHSIEEAIRDTVQREFSQRKASKQLSIHRLRDSGNARRADEMLSRTFQERRDDLLQTGRNSAPDKAKSDIRGAGQSDVSGAGRAEERLQRVLQTDNAASSAGRHAQEERGNNDRENINRKRSAERTQRNTERPSEAGGRPEEISGTIQFTHERPVEKVSEFSTERREQTVKCVRQADIARDTDEESGQRTARKSFRSSVQVQPGGHQENSSSSGNAGTGSVAASLRDVRSRTQKDREPELQSRQEEREIYARVKAIFEKSLEKLEEWRNAVIRRIRGTTFEGRDRPGQHSEQGRDSSLSASEQEKSISDTASYGSSSSARTENRRADSSRRIREYEEYSSERVRLSEEDSSGRTAQSAYDSFRRVDEHRSETSERGGESQGLLQFSFEDTFSKLHKEAGRVEDICSVIREEIDRQEHERSQKRIKVKAREMSEEIEMDF